VYQALYRKYRPRRFGDVAGQEHITETLRRQMVGDRLSHAYLFVGTRGTGKTTCAKILSAAVNCLNPEDGEPCNKCMACIGIEDGSILDVLELDAASNNSVDNVRALRDEAIYSPATVKKRVYIVDEVHMLSTSAFNALLKILEEPPEHILFILATTDLHKVPATIQSRCQRFSFKRLPVSVLVDRLNLIAEKEGIELTEDASRKLAMLADGSMRDGISLLDQCVSGDPIDSVQVQNTLGLAGQHEISRLVKAIAKRETVPALNILNDLYNDGRDMSSLLGETASIFRDLLICKLSPDSGLLNAGFDHALLDDVSAGLPPERLFYCLDVLKNALAGLSRSGSSKLSVEMCIIKMCDERLADDESAILSRLSSLEAGCFNPVSTASSDFEENMKSDLPIAEISNQDFSDSKKSINEASQPEEDKIDELYDQVADVVIFDDEKIPESQADAISVAKQSTPASGNKFTDIFGLLKKEASLQALLGDNAEIVEDAGGGALTLMVGDSFSANMIKAEFTDIIKEAAKKVLGRDVVINVDVKEVSSDDSKRSKLESLIAFDIVQFE